MKEIRKKGKQLLLEAAQAVGLVVEPTLTKRQILERLHERVTCGQRRLSSTELQQVQDFILRFLDQGATSHTNEHLVRTPKQRSAALARIDEGPSQVSPQEALPPWFTTIYVYAKDSDMEWSPAPLADRKLLHTIPRPSWMQSLSWLTKEAAPLVFCKRDDGKPWITHTMVPVARLADAVCVQRATEGSVPIMYPHHYLSAGFSTLWDPATGETRTIRGTWAFAKDHHSDRYPLSLVMNAIKPPFVIKFHNDFFEYKE